MTSTPQPQPAEGEDLPAPMSRQAGLNLILVGSARSWYQEIWNYGIKVLEDLADRF